MAKESPCARGKVICFSLYGGPDADFTPAERRDGVKRNMIWVDTMLEHEDGDQVCKLPHSHMPVCWVWHRQSTYSQGLAVEALERCAMFGCTLGVHVNLGGQALFECNTQDLEEEEKAIFGAFKAFFEDDGVKKVWHNYSFDRHVLYREVSVLLRPHRSPGLLKD